MIVGDAPAGGHDVWARLVARHLSKYLPGNPTVVVQNMPGAVQRIAANAIYQAKPDGLTIGVIANTIPTNQLRGEGPNDGVRYDVNKMNWLGSPNAATRVLVVHKNSGVTDGRQLETRSVKLGTDSPGTVTHITAVVLREGLGWKIESIFGYQGSSSVVLGMDRGEVDAFINSWDSWLSQKSDDLKAKVYLPLVQVGPMDPDPLLNGVPLADDLFATKSTEAKQVLHIAQRPFEWSFPFVAPPDVQPNVVATLRAAFTAALADPELIAEATKSGLRLNPATGEHVQELIADYMATPPEVVKRLDDLIAADSPG